MGTITIKAHTSDASQIDAIKAFMKALKIKFEVSKDTSSPYDGEFCEKVLQGDKDILDGKGKKLTVDELNALWK